MEPLATDSRPATFQIEFEIVEDSTKRGRNKLVDSRGYTYNVKRRRGGHIDWQCTVRPKGNVCRATVVERASGELVLGPTPHNHPGKVGASLAARIIAKTKKEAVANLFKPASEVVNEVLMEELTEDPCPSLPRPINLAKAANHLRQRLRPTDPVDLEFESQPEHIPQNFLRGDIRVRGRRHLLFASQQQLEVLCRAKAWYIDGTFKLCRNPFSQPLNINAFVRSDSFAKQVSLLFAIMSVLQAQKKRKNKPAERLCQLFRTQLDRQQHLATVLLECMPKRHPDQQRRRRMAQRAQPTGAGESLFTIFALLA
ncbi:hypothetical protein AWC38_SpisGene23227 [Stylophora pistillata]|uniref:FLYWCH-type domain-containing protein n=1 Tax=Stylophora pistillata TaxID=50429 RepID=A0A2B4R906_STYPI|nr:hypothetical protein AWC38_SpisGene23227 [Stylophora pistillata]